MAFLSPKVKRHAKAVFLALDDDSDGMVTYLGEKVDEAGFVECLKGKGGVGKGSEVVADGILEKVMATWDGQQTWGWVWSRIGEGEGEGGEGEDKITLEGLREYCFAVVGRLKKVQENCVVEEEQPEPSVVSPPVVVEEEEEEIIIVTPPAEVAVVVQEKQQQQPEWVEEEQAAITRLRERAVERLIEHEGSEEEEEEEEEEDAVSSYSLTLAEVKHRVTELEMLRKTLQVLSFTPPRGIVEGSPKMFASPPLPTTWQLSSDSPARSPTYSSIPPQPVQNGFLSTRREDHLRHVGGDPGRMTRNTPRTGGRRKNDILFTVNT